MSTALIEHVDPTPMMFLDRCGVDLTPEQTKAWMDLKERHEDRQAKQAFAIAMKACQDEMPIIVKDSENPKTRSRFSSLENVSKMAKPIYTKYGFTLSFHETKSDLPNHKRTSCDVRHDAGHTVEYYVDLPVDGIGPQGNPIGGMNAVQGNISSMSYGQRVLKCMIFDLTIAETDNDGNLSNEPIDEGQARTIEEWLVATSTNKARFLGWVSEKVGSKIENVSDMPAGIFDEAIEFFRKKEKR